MTWYKYTETKFAMNAVRQAALLVHQIQREMVTPAITKDDRSPVTVADYAAQALVSAMLMENFPQDPLVGEEDSSALRDPASKDILHRVSQFVNRFVEGNAQPETVCNWIDYGASSPADRFWTLDPIDGTKGFLRGDQFAVALALIVDGEVQVGVLGCPNLERGYQPKVGGRGSLVVAEKDSGTWLLPLQGDDEPTRLHVSEINDPSQARILRSFESGHTNVSKIDLFAQALGVNVEPVRMDSQAKYAVLAAGGGELYLRLLSPNKPDYREKIWDQAAGSLVIQEAGGTVTDLDGKKLDFSAGRTLANNRGICASNTYLHQAALEALRTINA